MADIEKFRTQNLLPFSDEAEGWKETNHASKWIRISWILSRYFIDNSRIKKREKSIWIN